MEGAGVAEVEEVPDAVSKESEVLLRVRMVGMCGTDLTTFRGRNSMVTFPRVPGSRNELPEDFYQVIQMLEAGR